METQLTMKPATPNVIARLSRGNVIEVKGRRGPQMVLKANWKRGLLITPYEGRIASRNLRAKQEREAGSSRGRPEYSDKARWVDPSVVTKYAGR